MDDNEQAQPLRIGGLWQKKDSRGNTMLSGNLNGITRILIFKNTKKKEQAEPDYIMYLAQKEAQPAQAQPAQESRPTHTQAQTATRGNQRRQPAQPAQYDDTDDFKDPFAE